MIYKIIKILLIVFAVVLIIQFFFPIYVINVLINQSFDKITADVPLNKNLSRALAGVFALFTYFTYTYLFSLNKKKRNTGIILFVISLISYPLVIYIIIALNGYNFNREGKSIRCCAENLQGGYEYVDCDLKVHPKYGTKVCDCTAEMIRTIEGKTYSSINRIKISPETRFFTRDGQPLLWYYEYADGTLEFFNQSGLHPQYNVALSPVSKEIARKALSQIETNNLQVIANNSNQTANNIQGNSNSETLIADYLISSQLPNQMSDLSHEVQTIVEQRGASATTEQNRSSSALNLKGKYRKLISLSGKLNSTESSIDPSAISTTYSYSIRIYDVEKSKTFDSKSDKIISIGFSESENVENIKKQIITQIKSML